MKGLASLLLVGCLIAAMVWAPAASARSSGAPNTQPIYSYHPRLRSIDVDPLPGCDFNGNCYTMRGVGIQVRSHNRPLFALSIPDGAAGAWLLKTAMAPVDQNGAVGLDLGEASAQAEISVRYCPKSAACAAQKYRSARDYYRYVVRTRGKLENPLVTAGRELAEVYSPLTDSRWRDGQAYEFSYAYAGRIRLQTQKVFPDRMRCDVVLIPGSEGLFVATYTVPEVNFPVGMEAFRRVIDSLKLWNSLLPAKTGTHASPFFPGLTERY